MTSYREYTPSRLDNFTGATVCYKNGYLNTFGGGVEGILGGSSRWLMFNLSANTFSLHLDEVNVSQTECHGMIRDIQIRSYSKLYVSYHSPGYVANRSDDYYLNENCGCPDYYRDEQNCDEYLQIPGFDFRTNASYRFKDLIETHETALNEPCMYIMDCLLGKHNKYVYFNLSPLFTAEQLRIIYSPYIHIPAPLNERDINISEDPRNRETYKLVKEWTEPSTIKPAK